MWGPSAKLLSEDLELQAAIRNMMRDGVIVEACVGCANIYGVADALREIGVDVKGMGPPLTEMLKSGYKVLTF